ncbi:MULTISPECIES: gamma carbonic anhydrase family protein [unclassified Beijerinckia]|uniref:gamma carbonic anhydrase family protein n=1 Tax=unclassified Beijerinckia TaxID=2638183 RepID=UPI000898451F|nr:MULTISPECIES: gamma carbonic anhydrase family protein [unclassified Beijerinckia]MDH7798772.1 carbonic anhydrase/acetyltransferase-like protein (isoleucine patch superfamily) [Beijerinckia sp. GAS462]SED32663.1 Carbonic anhydrase or acetyltransferase, isoleucine patch superfamily [Beijerinckia sp. 28-YEA-48]
MPVYAINEYRPTVADPKRCWIAPGAVVIGRVRLGLDVGIWFGAVLRGDTDLIEIGDGTNIQDGSILHTDPGLQLRIGANCTIGHRVTLHGCTIGPNTLIGMGATILNGAKIGANCLVGAGALVTEGKEFPDNSLIVGSPAKVVRTLDEKALAGMERNAKGYIANWQRYAAQLQECEPATESGT